jgi:thioredoxin reductase
MYDLIVVGGGLAGITATIYAVRRHLNVLLVAEVLGGKTNYQMQLPPEEAPLHLEGHEIIDHLKNEMERLDFIHYKDYVTRVSRHRDGFAVHTQEEAVLLGRSLVVATGVKHQRMHVPGEDKYLMRGLSYSALRYAPHMSGKTAVIIGDGELAVRAAAELALTTRHVYLVGPTGRELEAPLGKKVESASNVTIMEGYQVVEMLGDDYARSVVVSGPDGQREELKANMFFVEIAVIPNSQMVVGLVDLELSGHIRIDERGRTNVPGICAAGDVTNTYMEQVLVAAGGGVKAALSAYHYLLPSL